MANCICNCWQHLCLKLVDRGTLWLLICNFDYWAKIQKHCWWWQHHTIILTLVKSWLRRLKWVVLCVACVYSAVNTTRSSLMKDLTFTTGSTVLYSSAVNTVARLAHFTHLLSSSVCYCHWQKFAVAGPHVWNSLPATIRQITSYRQFRQHLRTHLFRA